LTFHLAFLWNYPGNIMRNSLMDHRNHSLFILTLLAGLLAPNISYSYTIDYPIVVDRGGIYVITVSGDENVSSVKGVFSKRNVCFNPTGAPGVFSGLLGVHIVASTGKEPLVIIGTTRNGKTESYMIYLTVRETSFSVESLSVDDKFVAFDGATKERIHRENAELSDAISIETPQRLWTKPFIKPCLGPITGTFGLTRFFNGKPSFPHMGIDISANTGEPVTASNDGKVALILDTYMGGLTLLIDHGQGLYTFYCHLSGVLVRVGDTVRQGKPVALVGATGRVTGAHLHFGVFLNHHLVNPDELINKRFW
jgi:hypothetical protein